MNNAFSHRQHAERSGATLLITVMILGTIALLIGITLAMRGIGEMEMSTSSYQREKVLGIADGCMEETLMQLWRNPAYASGSILLPPGTCDIEVLRGSGSLRTVVVHAQIEQWFTTLKIEVDVNSAKMNTSHWQQE